MIVKSRLFLLLISVLNVIITDKSVVGQKQFVKNPHVVYQVSSDDEHYSIIYTFKDHYGGLQQYTLTLPFEYTNQEIEIFGIAKWLFEPYIDNENNRYARDAELTRGLFKLRDNVIEVDKSAIINHYAETFCKPIAEMIVSSLENYNRDTRNDRIEMAMRFVQDIPYGIPVLADKNRHFGGVSPPPALLIGGYGDCDSKAILFVSILIYLIPANDIVFLNQSEHVLSAVKGEPGGIHTFIKFNGNDFLIAETAGPGNRKLGEKGSYFSNKFIIEQLSIAAPDPLIFNSAVTEQLPIDLSALPPEKNVLVITNCSEKTLQFQLSQDKVHWKGFSLRAGRSGQYTFENEMTVFIKLFANTEKQELYKLHTGNNYRFTFNSPNKVWEVQ